MTVYDAALGVVRLWLLLPSRFCACSANHAAGYASFRTALEANRVAGFYGIIPMRNFHHNLAPPFSMSSDGEDFYTHMKQVLTSITPQIYGRSGSSMEESSVVEGIARVYMERWRAAKQYTVEIPSGLQPQSVAFQTQISDLIELSKLSHELSTLGEHGGKETVLLDALFICADKQARIHHVLRRREQTAALNKVCIVNGVLHFSVASL